MKHILCCMLLCTGAVISSFACNTCGSSSTGQSLGLLPSMHKHFAGVQYQRRIFSSIHTALAENNPAEHSEEHYNTFQVWGRYHLGERVQVFGFVPYQVNIQRKGGSATQISGVGDVSVLANVALIRTEDEEAKWNSVLLAGGGVKAPTGAWSSVNVTDRNGLPNMQPGSGAWDFIMNANYTLQNGQWGSNAEASYTVTTVSEDGYKYGNKLSAGLLAFYKWQKGNFAMLPQAGARCEYALHDYDNYKRKWLNEQTGGCLIYGSIGLQAYYKRAGLQLNYLLPLPSYYAGGNVTAGYSASAGLFILL